MSSSSSSFRRARDTHDNRAPATNDEIGPGIQERGADGPQALVPVDARDLTTLSLQAVEFTDREQLNEQQGDL